ncbi:MAG TPA: 16S rRNA (cytidine(1402)-2'-O)-methyltransferase [Actinomycetota bacterium]|nr:16S rRNA (cytidine(1402)-2'-O)-methyltransferase [Actinomycetota bacterium]
MAGVLHIVATPIGNLGDLSDRARATLATVDLVVAEDTRRTGKLLASLGIDARMRSMFEGNERRRTDEIVEELLDGRIVALVSDGGTPLVSDPGYRLVRACVEEGIEVRVVPGPSAAIAALVVSGLATDRFVFEGFLPRTAGDRRARLAALADEPRTVVLYESPRRLATLLADLAAIEPDRRVAVCRELTKLHEEVRRGTVAEVRQAIGDGAVRGEVVVVLEGRPAGASVDVDAAVAEARELVADGARKRDAAHQVAERTGVPANAIYRALVPEATG